MKEVLWSRTVQHGQEGGPNVIIRALKTLDIKTATKKQVVEAIYKESGSVIEATDLPNKGKLINESNFSKGISVKRQKEIIEYAKKHDLYNKALKYFSKNSTDIQVSVWKRINLHEKEQVLKKFCTTCNTGEDKLQ